MFHRRLEDSRAATGNRRRLRTERGVFLSRKRPDETARPPYREPTPYGALPTLQMGPLVLPLCSRSRSNTRRGDPIVQVGDIVSDCTAKTTVRWSSVLPAPVPQRCGG